MLIPVTGVDRFHTHHVQPDGFLFRYGLIGSVVPKQVRTRLVYSTLLDIPPSLSKL